MSITPTPSENDEEFDIYEDLGNFNNEKVLQEVCDVESLKQQVSSLQTENKTLREQNKNLSSNISILYNTAAEEIKRKDKAIEDLRRELDSYLFRRNGRKPNDCVSTKQPVGIPLIPHTLPKNSKRSTNPENLECTASSSNLPKCHPCATILPSPERKDNSLRQVKAERIIKEVPKKRKVIEFNVAEEERSVDEATSDSKGVHPKLSVFERLGHRRSTTLPAKETKETPSKLTLNVNEKSESNMKRIISKSDEEKEGSQPNPCTEASTLSDPMPSIGEKNSKPVEPIKSLHPGKVEVLLNLPKEESGKNVEKHSKLLEGPMKKEVAACEPLLESFQPLLVTNEAEVPPESCVPFQPPLPKGDPLPPPPLPSSTPPPTPVKCIQYEESKSNFKSETHDLKDKDRAVADLLISQGNLSESNSPENPKECEKNIKPRWSDENLYMQCPFKPRRRAKSVVVVEDASDGDNKITSQSMGPLKAETSSRTIKSSDKFKRTPLKKSDVQENRLSTDRPYQTQRSVHSNRHLSLKSYVNLPERRSPSELLNGRSGRIARISHHDKVRARIRDRRSRSLSPQKKRIREDDHRTKTIQKASTTREGYRRNISEDCGGNIDKNQDEKMLKSAKKKPVIPKEELHKVKQKMAELFGESSPEPEEKLSKNLIRNVRSAHSPPDGPVEFVSKNEETSLLAASLNPSMNTGSTTLPISVNNIHPEENIIFIKRRPRSSIKFSNSEDAAHNTQILSVQSLQQDSLSCKIPLSKASDDASDIETKSVKPIQSEERDPKRTTAAIPLYFRERGVKRGTCDDGLLDEDLIGESEESLTNADSDDTYNPKMSLNKSSKRKPSKKKK